MGEILYNEHLGDVTEFFEENKKLVWSVVKKMNRVLEMDDMFQCGSIGLLKAYEKYVPIFEGKPIKFSTYGVPMIMGEIQRAVRDSPASGGIKFSRQVKENFYKMRRGGFLDKKVSNKEVASALDVSEHTVEKAIQFGLHRTAKSMDVPVFSNGDSEILLQDTLGVDVDLSYVTTNEFTSRLPSRLQKIVELRLSGATQHEMAEHFGISQVQISRLIKNRIQPVLLSYINNEDIAKQIEHLHYLENRRHNVDKKRTKKRKGESKLTKKAEGDYEAAKAEVIGFIERGERIPSSAIARRHGCNLASVVTFGGKYKKKLKGTKKEEENKLDSEKELRNEDVVDVVKADGIETVQEFEIEGEGLHFLRGSFSSDELQLTKPETTVPNLTTTISYETSGESCNIKDIQAEFVKVSEIFSDDVEDIKFYLSAKAEIKK